MAGSPEEIKKSIRSYIIVCLILFVFTGVTVAVASFESLDVGKHGFDAMDMVLGLCIATFKATLVGAIFMHLNHEKKAIYWIFFGAIAFFILMIALFMFAKSDPIFYPLPQ